MIADQPYSRQLAPPDAQVRPLALLRPDARLLGHAGPGLASLRITRADGTVVAWRLVAGRPRAATVPARRLSGGETTAGAIAEFDLGGARSQRGLDLQLQLRDGALTGRVRVLGSPDRRAWARFARGVVYRIADGSSVPASSTRIVYAPVDYRYLRIEIAGAARIDGARATLATPAPVMPEAPVELPPTRTSTFSTGSATGITLRLLGRPTVAEPPHRHVRAAPRPAVRGRGAGPVRRLGGGGERRPAPHDRPAPFVVRGLASARGALRVRIVDGSDAPLPGLHARVFADPRTLVLERPGAGPLTLRYGSGLAAPSYEFARLPLQTATGLVAWSLRPEVRRDPAPPLGTVAVEAPCLAGQRPLRRADRGRGPRRADRRAAPARRDGVLTGVRSRSRARGGRAP